MLQHVSDVLLDTCATLYAVDPTSTPPTVTEITDPTQLEFAQATDGGRRNLDPFDKSLDFDRLGPVTGGRVMRGLNDVDVKSTSPSSKEAPTTPLVTGPPASPIN